MGKNTKWLRRQSIVVILCTSSAFQWDIQLRFSNILSFNKHAEWAYWVLQFGVRNWWWWTLTETGRVYPVFPFPQETPDPDSFQSKWTWHLPVSLSVTGTRGNIAGRECWKWRSHQKQTAHDIFKKTELVFVLWHHFSYKESYNEYLCEGLLAFSSEGENTVTSPKYLLIF